MCEVYVYIYCEDKTMYDWPIQTTDASYLIHAQLLIISMFPGIIYLNAYLKLEQNTEFTAQSCDSQCPGLQRHQHGCHFSYSWLGKGAYTSLPYVMTRQFQWFSMLLNRHKFEETHVESSGLVWGLTMETGPVAILAPSCPAPCLPLYLPPPWNASHPPQFTIATFDTCLVL